MTIVMCAPDPAALGVGDLYFSVMQVPTNENYGTVGLRFLRAVSEQGIEPSAEAWDFAILALAVIAADFGCSRAQSPDGWTREIELHVALVNPLIWQPHITIITQALQFLTGDIWCIRLHEGGVQPLQISREPIVGDCVSLLSGGTDSLVGAIDLTSQGRIPIFVSQIVKGDATRQQTFARAVGREQGHIQLSHTVRGRVEGSQRSRSIIFLAFGALAASSIQPANHNCSLFVPENGFISYNVPLTTLRIGSLSTRTTHPYFLGLIQNLWNRVGLNINIVNPYQFKTKGEMLLDCSNQTMLQQLASNSTSCGRFGRYKLKHCGRCVPCLVRQAAFFRWNMPDTTSYHYNIIDQRNFDDVRSVALAYLQSREIGVHRWARNALSSSYIDNTAAAVDLIERGLLELYQLFNNRGIL